MKVLCLDTQDCGYVKILSSEEIKAVNINAPFQKCELCNYYAVVSSKPIEENVNLEVYKKLIKAFKKE